jgi:small GTP-binding protein
MDEKLHDYVFKVLLIGEPSVGKTSLLMRFCDNQFPESHKATIGVDFKIKTIDILSYKGVEKRVKLQIWDTAGSERHFSFTKSYYRGADAAIVVFGLNERTTYERIPYWLDNLEQNVDDKLKFRSRILVGNKCDLVNQREVPKKDATEFSELYNIEYIETSAKIGNQVEAMFIRIAQLLTDSCVKNDLKNNKTDTLVLNANNNNNNENDTTKTTNRSCCGGT